MKSTLNADRIHIALYGRTNSGKSSLANAILKQPVSMISDMAGTTTDPVRKAMEMPGVGAVVLIDTPGFGDTTALGEKRIEHSLKTMDEADIALLLCSCPADTEEKKWMMRLKDRNIPTLLILSKADLNEYNETDIKKLTQYFGEEPMLVSAHNPEDIEKIYQAIALKIEQSTGQEEERTITGGLVQAGDVVLLVMPQDASAPKGRLILPQVQTIRELLDKGCSIISCTPDSLNRSLEALKEPPTLIITDSQVFKEIYPKIPQTSLLTSFSVLMAAYKGDSDLFVAGAQHLSHLPANARILIAEACTHAPQGEDIGRVKLPRMLRNKLGHEIKIDIRSGKDFPQDLTSYDLIIHCGACLFHRKIVQTRIAQAMAQAVPITNYGMAIAHLTGILSCVSIPYLKNNPEIHLQQ